MGKKCHLFHVVLLPILFLTSLIHAGDEEFSLDMQLLKAVMQGNQAQVQELLAAGASVQAVDERGAGVLHFACQREDLELARFLLAEGAKANVVGPEGWQPLHIAAAAEQTKMVELLLFNGAAINAPTTDGTTVLHMAVQHGNPELTKLLLDKGATIDAADENGMTALHFATEQNDMAMVQLLVRRGADMYARTGPNDMDLGGYTALHLAAINSNTELMGYFLEQGMNIETRDYNGETPLFSATKYCNIKAVEYLVSKGAYIHAYNSSWVSPTKNVEYNTCYDVQSLLLELGGYSSHHPPRDKWELYGYTPLQIAVAEKGYNVVQQLIDQGADVNVRNKLGKTALHLSFIPRREINMTKLLLKNGASPNIADNEGQTLLFDAAFYGNVELVKLLLEYSPDINRQDVFGNTCLIFASRGYRNGCAEVMRLLVDAGADANAQTTDGSTALHEVVLGRQNDAIKRMEILVEAGANVNLEDRNGFSPYQVAKQNHAIDEGDWLLAHGAQASLSELIRGGNQEAAAQMILDGANFHGQNDKGSTWLHITAYNGQLTIVKALVECGADINAVNKRGCTPLYFAVQEGHQKIVYFLLEQGADKTIVAKDGSNALGVAKAKGHHDIIELMEQGDESEAYYKGGENEEEIKIKAMRVARKKRSTGFINMGHWVDQTSFMLHKAVYQGNIDKVRKLLTGDVDINAIDEKGLTPLIYAVRLDDEAITRMLLEAGADINFKNVEQDFSESLTPIQWAAEFGLREMVELLLEYNPECDLTELAARTIKIEDGWCFDLLLDKGADMAKGLDGKGATLLHKVCENYYYPLSNLHNLLKRGVNVEIKDNKGNTPLMIIANTPGTCSTEKALLLLENGANVNTVNASGETALFNAAESSCPELMALYLRYGADSTIISNSGDSALHKAVQAVDEDEKVLACVKMLIDAGVPLHQLNRRGRTALSEALITYQPNGEVIKLLLSYSEVNAELGKNGKTVLEQVVSYGDERSRTAMAQLLLDAGADVNHRDKLGQTVLHNAVTRHNLELVKVLLEAGADVTIPFKDGVSMLSEARRRKADEIAALLEQYGAVE